jgi:hypothetical protein
MRGRGWTATSGRKFPPALGDKRQNAHQEQCFRRRRYSV